VSPRNPAQICFQALPSPRFRDGRDDRPNNSECDLSIIFRQPATNDLERRVPQFHPIPTLRILRATFSGVDYNTGLEIVEELRKLVPSGISMSQFGLRWILMFDAHTCAIPGGKRADRLRTAPMLASSAY